MSSSEQETELIETILRTTRETEPQSVNQLIGQIRERNPGSSQQEIFDLITKLQNQGKLKLRPPPSTNVSFARVAWYWITLALTFVTIPIVFAVSEDAYPYVYIRHVLSAVFVLWLPGYTLIRLLFPQTEKPELEGKGLDLIERIALSLGMSLALVSLVGLLLNYLPWGIRFAPITLSLAILTLVFATVALAREHGEIRTAQQEKTLPF